MSKTKDSRIKSNEMEIERLHAERRDILSNITKTANEKEFMSENRKCIELLGKINVLEKKNHFMENNMPPNGIADIGSGVKIIE